MTWTLFETKIGTCGLAWSDAGITAMQLPEESVDATTKRLTSKLYDPGNRATKKTTPAFATTAITRLRDHLAGKPQIFDDLPLDLAHNKVTDFNQGIYAALRKIPSGKTITYGDLAKAAGSNVGASRAVGRAMGMNPVPVIVPCHRVTAAGGKPGGFSAYGGIVTKDKLLTLEGTSLTPTPSLFANVDDESFPYDRVAALKHLMESDAVLAAHLAKVGDFALSLKGTESTFGALAESIVYQQLNGKAAGTIFGRVKALFPKKRLSAERLLVMADKDLRMAGLSKNKLAALRDLAERTSRGEIPTIAELMHLDDDAIVEKLTQVRGIGRWTVEMLLIFRLGRPDVLPVADYGIKKGYARLFHRGKKREELPKDVDMVKRAEKWKPYRSVASWYLWRATEMD